MSYSDKQKRDYYRVLADVTAIFWEFHKCRLAYEGWNFTSSSSRDQLNLDLGLKHAARNKLYRPCYHFFEKSRLTLRSSFDDFKLLVACDPFYKNLSPQARAFFNGTTYIRDIWREAAEIRSHNRHRFSFPVLYEDVGIDMSKGINTAFMVMTQLCALSPSPQRTRQAMMLSKCDIEGINVAIENLGLHTTRLSLFTPRPDSYLSDNSEVGLNRAMLREAGLGRAIGCPASMPPRQETKDFLATRGIEFNGTMLGDFSQYFIAEFDMRVRDWYNELTPDQKLLIKDSEYNLLEGVVLYEAQQRAEGNCPYHRGKES